MICHIPTSLSSVYLPQVSGAVCFLLSPAAAYITGCTLPVDGGQSIYRSPWVIQGKTTPPHHITTTPSPLPIDHEGFPVQLHSDVELPPKGEATEPPPSEELFKMAVELHKSKL